MYTGVCAIGPKRTNGYDTPHQLYTPIAFDFLLVKSRPQNPKCQVIPLPSLGPNPNAYPNQFRDPSHTIPIPTPTYNLGKPNLTIVTHATLPNLGSPNLPTHHLTYLAIALPHQH